MGEAKRRREQQRLIAEIDDVIAEMTSANGRAPSLSWVEAEMWRRHPGPPDIDLDPAFRLGAIEGLRSIIRRRLGLPESTEPAAPVTPDELREQGDRLHAHAAELRRYADERRPPC